MLDAFALRSIQQSFDKGHLEVRVSARGLHTMLGAVREKTGAWTVTLFLGDGRTLERSVKPEEAYEHILEGVLSLHSWVQGEDSARLVS